MALISCPDCNKQVSDKAPACPQCGSPIATAEDIQRVGTGLTTTQQTSKRLKGHLLTSGLIFAIGGIWTFASTGDPSGGSSIAVLLMLGGLIWQITTRFQIWWHHK